MSITCEFVPTRSSSIYYSGEEIAGWLKISSLKSCHLAAILLEFYGCSVVQWWELDKSEENIMHSDISSHEMPTKTICTQQQKHVWQQLSMDLPCNKCFQPHVDYTFKYSFQIPEQVPATFDCFYGRTEYGLRLRLKHVKTADKEFHKRIIVKNKLDLSQEIAYKKNCAVCCFNNFGKISMQLPCSGFTPGQTIPYHLKHETTETDYNLFIQFNCYVTCRIDSSCNKLKQIKQMINVKKHLPTETSSFVSIPLYCYSSSLNDPELLIKIEYFLEALLVKSNKKVLLKASIPLTIGTTPCYASAEHLESSMCFNNWSATFEEFSEHLNFPEP